MATAMHVHPFGNLYVRVQAKFLPIDVKRYVEVFELLSSRLAYDRPMHASRHDVGKIEIVFEGDAMAPFVAALYLTSPAMHSKTVQSAMFEGVNVAATMGSVDLP